MKTIVLLLLMTQVCFADVKWGKTYDNIPFTEIEKERLSNTEKDIKELQQKLERVESEAKQAVRALQYEIDTLTQEVKNVK